MFVGSLLIVVAAVSVAAATSQSDNWHPLELVVVLAVFAASSGALAARSVGEGAAPWMLALTAPLVLAMALLGPAPAMAIAAAALLAAAIRVRPAVRWLAGSLANYGTVAVGGGLFLQCLIHTCVLAPHEPGASMLFLGAFVCASGVSFLFFAIQRTLAWQGPAWVHVPNRWGFALSGLAMALLATCAAYSYRTLGIAALGLLVMVQLAFQFRAGSLVISPGRADALEAHARQLSELSAIHGHLVGQVLEAEEAERRRLAEALHGDALQNLLAAQNGLASTSNGGIDNARTAIERAIDQLRGEIFDLHPTVLKHLGLEAALIDLAAHQAERGGFRAEVNVAPEACGLHDQLLFALGREQLTNAAKHSNATEVSLVVRRKLGKVVMEVTDNGRGMDPDRPHAALRQGHIGLASSIERIDALGGKFEIDSKPGHGTCIRTTLPCQRRLANYRNIPRRIASATAAARFETPSFS